MPSRSRTARSRRREAERRQAKTDRKLRRVVATSSSHRALTRAEIGDHPLSAISAAVMTTIRKDFYHETQPEFARRAGVSPAVIRDAESGARPAWALSRGDFNAIIEAIAVQTETGLAHLFDQAAASDLALSRFLIADGISMADLAITASLLQDRYNDGSWPLVLWALGPAPQECCIATSGLHVLKPPSGPLVTAEVRARLRHAVAVHAGTGVYGEGICAKLLEVLNG